MSALLAFVLFMSGAGHIDPRQAVKPGDFGYGTPTVQEIRLCERVWTNEMIYDYKRDLWFCEDHRD